MTDEQGTPYTSQTVLEYAPQSGSRRRRFIRGMLIFISLVIISAGVWHRSYISFRIREAYWFSRCMSHVTPPGTVLFEHDPAKAKLLIAGNLEYHDVSRYVLRRPPMGARPKVMQAAAQSNAIYGAGMAQYVPAELRELENFIDMDSFYTMQFAERNLAAVYVGKMRSPAGAQRLVIIRGSVQLDVALPQLLDVQVYAAPTLLRPAQRVDVRPPLAVNFSGQPRWAILSAAVPDAADPSHLSIDYIITEQIGTGQPMRRGVIDVYLLSDNTFTVSMRPAR